MVDTFSTLSLIDWLIDSLYRQATRQEIKKSLDFHFRG